MAQYLDLGGIGLKTTPHLSAPDPPNTLKMNPRK